MNYFTNDRPHGMSNSSGLGELPDTGVTNGRLMPGRAAHIAAMAITAVILLCPLFL